MKKTKKAKPLPDAVLDATITQWETRSESVDTNIFSINGFYVPYAVSTLGPGMADSSMKSRRDKLFADVVVQNGHFPTRDAYLNAPDITTARNLEKRLHLGRVQLQTLEQVFCDYE